MMSFAVLLLLAVSLCLTCAEQCRPKTDNPCRFDCNGTDFDISQLFEYPHNISDQYVWSPCKGYPCPDYSQKGILVAVCQYRDYAVSCGQYQDPVFILQRTDPYMFSIEYASGTTWRISIFRFIVDENYPETSVIFTGEMPNLQYNFQVTGKCLGQPNCKVKGPNPFH